MGETNLYSIAAESEWERIDFGVHSGSLSLSFRDKQRFREKQRFRDKQCE